MTPHRVEEVPGAWSVAGNADYIVYGGEFPKVNNQAQQGWCGSPELAWPPTPTAPG